MTWYWWLLIAVGVIVLIILLLKYVGAKGLAAVTDDLGDVFTSFLD